jgi:general secretion pathway protein H
MQRQRGLTLLELLVVLAIIAVASAGVVFAMRDTTQSLLEREGQRLIAQLEAARTQSRAQGVPLVWTTTASGFVIASPVPDSGFVAQRENWLSQGTVVDQTTIALGPEPIIPPATLTLSTAGGRARRIHAHTGAHWHQRAEAFHRLP